uniref:Uncharacterized protein n=1 Tax=Glossina austeni TaxID=7395 RepID=A0A1A9V677_GLOAU
MYRIVYAVILFGRFSYSLDDQPIPFDTTSDKSIEDQREDCLIRIHKLLRARKLDHAIALMRAARDQDSLQAYCVSTNFELFYLASAANYINREDKKIYFTVVIPTERILMLGAVVIFEKVTLCACN